MQPLARIVVAVDESAAAEAALTEAIALARAAGAELVLAHVTTILGERLAAGDHRPVRVPDASTPALAKATERARSAGVRFSTELLIGYAPRQLALVADDLDADLVVIGSRNHRGIKRVVLGSTAHELLKESSRPVLVVPAAAAAERAA